MRRVCKFAGLLTALMFATGAGAATIGTTVDGVGGNAVGSTEFRLALGGQAVEYYIPLASGPACTYGAGCGTASDSGTGGTLMSMFLKFSGLSAGTGVLNINFEDLDLIGANDPANFLEEVQIFDSVANALTGVISNIADPLVSGNAVTQQLLSLDLGLLAAGDYFLELRFSANSTSWGSNTPEYLRAEIEMAPVPLPAAGGLLLLGLAGLGAAARRKRAG